MASFVVDKEKGSGKFSAFLNLQSLDLPADAEVVVEAYRQSLSERFRFGTVGKLHPVDSTVLTDLDAQEVAFRVKVIAHGTGKVLARGDAFRPADGEDSGRRPLLTVVVRQLGNRPWLVERADAGMQLVLNQRIEEAEKRIKGDPSFRALILPAALHMVLLTLWAEGAHATDGDDDDPDALWFRFSRELGCEPPDALDDDPDTTRNWIDDVCTAFCSKNDYAGMIDEEMQA